MRMNLSSVTKVAMATPTPRPAKIKTRRSLTIVVPRRGYSTDGITYARAAASTVPSRTRQADRMAPQAGR